MNRRGFLTGLASLVVPVPAAVTAPFVVNCAGRVGGIRAGEFISRGSLVDSSGNGNDLSVAGMLRDVVLTGSVSV